MRFHEKADARAMMNALYTDGTQRICQPEETLHRISSKLRLCGITRVPDITRLDRPGIHTCCAVRPTSSVMQVSNGKGTTKVAAQVSALMESIELFHAEDSQAYESRWQAQSEFSVAERVADHRSFASFRADVHFTPSTKIRWIEASHVKDQGPAWIPACSVFFDQDRFIHATTTNGLASGNNLLEASLHALYEVIERDAGSRLSEGGTIRFGSRGSVLDPLTIGNPALKSLTDSLAQQGKLVICYVRSIVDVYTFWVVSLNAQAQSALTAVNIGWGTHADRDIALSRALTEAAQARLAIIHGAREDIISRNGYGKERVRESAAYRFFEKLSPTMAWSELPDHPLSDTRDLDAIWASLLQQLKLAGYPDVYRFNLTRPDLDIPVAKIIVPGLAFNQRMF